MLPAGWSPASVDAIQKGHCFVKVYGRIDYEDVFGNPHTIAFYFYYNGLANSFHAYRRAGQNNN